jgi:hypothetical protein
MATNTQIWQMARLLGKDEFLNCLSLTSLDELQGLDGAQLAKVQQCTLDNASRITRALVHEAAAREDVVTARQAAAYLEQRLAALGDLLGEETRQRIREGFLALTTGWGEPSTE